MERQANNSTEKDAVDILKGLIYHTVGILLKIGKAIFVFAAAKFYGTAALGLYFLAYGVIDIASKFGLWGMDRSLIREIAGLQGSRDAVARKRIAGLLRFHLRQVGLFSLLAMAVLIAAAPYLGQALFGDPGLVAPLRLLALALPAMTLTIALIAATKALRLMQYEVWIRQGLEPAILLLTMIILIPFDLGASGLALAQLLASSTAVLAAGITVWRLFRPAGVPAASISPVDRRAIFRYSTPIAGMDFINLSAARVDMLLVGGFLTPVAAGMYGIMIEIISVIKRVRQGFEPIFAPIVAELAQNRQQQRLQRNYVLVTRWLIAGSLLPVAAILLFPEQILALFDIYDAVATATLRLLAVAHGLFSIFSAAENLLVMTGFSAYNALFGACMLVANLTAGVLLIPLLGLPGAASATLVAFTATSLARIYLGYRQLHLQPFGTASLWPLTTAVVAAAVMYMLKIYLAIDSMPKVIVAFFALTILYASVYFWGAHEEEERFLLVKLRHKLKRR